jgi:hypothetical protein
MVRNTAPPPELSVEAVAAADAIIMAAPTRRKPR